MTKVQAILHICNIKPWEKFLRMASSIPQGVITADDMANAFKIADHSEQPDEYCQYKLCLLLGRLYKNPGMKEFINKKLTLMDMRFANISTGVYDLIHAPEPNLSTEEWNFIHENFSTVSDELLAEHKLAA